MNSRILAAAIALTTSGAASADEWQWSVTPYLWATDVGIDLSVSDRELVDATIEFDHPAGESASLNSSDTFVDGLIGVRYLGSLPGRWSYAIAADVSTGGTELTWSASSALGYTFGADSQYQLTAGYRHMVVDFDTAASVDMDMTLSGFLIGFRYAF